MSSPREDPADMFKYRFDGLGNYLRNRFSPRAPRPTVILYGYRVLSAFILQQKSRTPPQQFPTTHPVYT